LSDGRHSNTSYIELFAHTGTHVDAPWHFIPDGAQILDYRIQDYIFQSVLLLDIPAAPLEPLPVSALQSWQKQLSECDALLIRTGFSAYRLEEPSTYLAGNPGLSLEAGRYLAGFEQLRCIGVDWPSIENVPKGRRTGFPVHHALLGRQAPTLLLEDANLAALAGHTIRRMYLFPLRIAELEASPVTAVAEVED